jgi:hypothetical protein
LRKKAMAEVKGRKKIMNILEKQFIKKRDLVTRPILGETIIVPVRTKVGDLDAIYTLSEMGTVVWDLLDGKSSVGQVIEAVCRKYEVAPERAAKDVADFLESLEKAGLIGPPGAAKD